MNAKRQKCAGGKKECHLGVILMFFGVMEKVIAVENSMKNVGGLFFSQKQGSEYSRTGSEFLVQNLGVFDLATAPPL